MNFYRPTWVEVSLKAFASNIRACRAQAGPKVKLMAVLKADAYGHGAVSLAPVAMAHGASSIGVSSLEEALQLRDAGLKAPLLLLGGVYPFECFEIALRNNLMPTVASLEAARFLEKVKRKMGSDIPFHLKVDTGMGRLGLSIQEAKNFLKWLDRHPNLTLAGIYSHLSCADSDPVFTRHQLKTFQDLKNHARSLGFKDTLFHIANSSGLFRFKESHHDLVRPGIALYTNSPVLSWQTRAIFLKKVGKGTPISYGRTFVTKRISEIATLPVGYADGVPRSVSNKGWVLVKGKKRPMIGRVTMDHIMVDVTGLNVKTGDPVVLIGKQGQQTLTADDWARWAGTISYEIFCGISKRVPRVVIA